MMDKEIKPGQLQHVPESERERVASVTAKARDILDRAVEELKTLGEFCGFAAVVLYDVDSANKPEECFTVSRVKATADFPAYAMTACALDIFQRTAQQYLKESDRTLNS
jgi:hypothetical protein